MDKFIINGGIPLEGEVLISGAKNASLPIMAATIIVPGEYCLHNVPELRDTLTMKKLLEMVGATVNYENNTMHIDTTYCDTPIAPYELVKTMRASFYVLGPLLSRFRYAQVSLPGGCAWGPRPVNYHLQAMEAMGAKIELSNGMIVAKGKLKGATINFQQSSVGATGNALMAAINAQGTTNIINAAQEPEIESLCIFLNKMGEDMRSIIRLVKFKPKTAKIYISEYWKYLFVKKLKKEINKTRNIGELIKSLVDGKHSKEISKLVPYYLKDESRIPKVILGQKKEIEIIQKNRNGFGNEFSLKVIIEKDNPKAFPGKPAILLE